MSGRGLLLRRLQSHRRVSTQRLARLRVHDAVLATAALDEVRVLGFQPSKRALGVPVPHGIRREEQIHVLQRPLVTLRVQGPDHGNGNGVGNAEYVERLLANRSEHDRAQKRLSVVRSCRLLMRPGQQGLTSQPFPILQPTTPQALPRARTAKGKISAGYSQGTVSHVAPKTEVKIKTMEAAAAPYCDALAVSPASEALMPRREKPPARNMAMPCATDPQ